MPRQKLQAKDHQDHERSYEGVPLVELVRLADVPLGKELRGPALANYLVVEAADGYRAIFALAELDPAMTDNVVLLVDRQDGQPLDAHDGPLRIVAPQDKRHARWVRQVTALRLLTAPRL